MSLYQSGVNKNEKKSERTSLDLYGNSHLDEYQANRRTQFQINCIYYLIELGSSTSGNKVTCRLLLFLLKHFMKITELFAFVVSVYYLCLCFFFSSSLSFSHHTKSEMMCSKRGDENVIIILWMKSFVTHKLCFSSPEFI